MDQSKIGRFIAECRKKQGLTQIQLAEKLGITDRAVSKWETGKSLPDSALMLDLCKELSISVNDLLCGERVAMENYNKKLEQNLLEMVRQKEEADRRLLASEIFIGAAISVILFGCIFAAAYMPMENWLRTLLVVLGFIVFIFGATYALRIEQTAGYYRCGKCGYTYVPTYSSVFVAMHAGRTRYMKCPHCHKHSWQKKIIRKE